MFILSDMNKMTPLFFTVLFFIVNGCGMDNPPATYQVIQAFPALSFTRPVDLQHAGDNTNRIFVVEQEGVISVFPNDMAVTSKKTFLDIKDRVNDSGNEEGLLGLAFHPNYETNGFFYVNYTASGPRRTVISRFTVSGDADAADVGSEYIIMEFNQPFSNHNGGQLSFGADGFLYIATGDGGSGGDPDENGQSRETLLGKILRIDVNSEEEGNKYAIPDDNPYKDNDDGYREEIYAYGLRNPWRFSFDPVTNWLWTGDVGQNQYEEIDIIEKGGNYGWDIMEGNHCFEPSSGCNQAGLKLPIWEYPRSMGISVTGGFVYRGSEHDDLYGKYIYADFGSGRIWSINFKNLNSVVNTQLLQAPFNISSFGVDQNNELYICSFDDKIYKLEEK
jgi:glucose/arabinose dehydrogenase